MNKITFFICEKTLFLILCSPVKVVLVMGGGLHMGDLLQEQKQQISKMGYSESTLFKKL